MENTTLVVVATDARLDRSALQRVCVQAHDALAVCLRPSHTRYDGDAAFAVSCGEVAANLDGVGTAAYVATGRAIEAAMRAAAPMGGVPAMEER
jgi:L-aminopeptidase/D-esterase-like protein